MTDQLAPDAAQAPEGSTAPEAVTSAEDVNSAPAQETADPAAAPEATEGDAAEAPTANDQDTTQPDKPVKAKPTARDRIAEVIAERNAERERAKAAADAAEFWRKKALGETQAAPEQPKAAPKLADFEFDTERWAEAHAKWTEEQVDARAQAAAQRLLEQRGQSEQQAQVLRSFEARETEFAKSHPDYHAVTGDPRLAEFATPTIAQVMAVSEQGPALGYHLATHPDELVRISRLTPIQQAQALGRIEATLQKAPPAVRKTVTTTRAPAPPSPVGGAVPSKQLQDMDIHEYMANRTWGHPT
jgi:hypothetical protein